MASIFTRKNKDGTTTYRVQIRRKGLKSFSTAFCSKEEALQFIKENEEKYCLDDDFTFDHLKSKREREFTRIKNEG